MSRPGTGLRAPVREKYVSASWIEEQLAGLRYGSLYEPFCGRAALGRYFKRRGKRVVASDMLEGHHLFALALVANNAERVEAARLGEWLTLIKDPAVATRFSAWAPGLFTPEEAIWLGIWHAHLGRPGLPPTQRALGAVAVAHVMDYWLAYNERGQTAKPMTPPVAFQHYLQTVNTWVCNNGHENQAHWGDAHDLAPQVDADLMVCYPPTDQGYLDYPEGPALFESWLQGVPEGLLPGLDAPSLGPPSLGNPLGPDEFAHALTRFLEVAAGFPTWAIAYHDRYPLDEADMIALVREFRPVTRRARLSVATGGRGAPPTERLLVAQL